VVALVDARFARADYRRLLPAYWAVRCVEDATRLSQDLKRFWEQMDGREASILDGRQALPADVAAAGKNHERDHQARHRGAAAT
jgi:hypothetical protein